jgi:predicted nucleotidyltransferase
MNVHAIFELISRRLPQAGVEYLLIGGFAVNYYGYTRNTLDVDFMVASDQIDAVKAILGDAGFINISVEDNVVFFNRPDMAMRVDFLRVDNGTLKKLIAHAQEVDFYGCRITVPALKDLLAMKIFALAQSGGRRMGKDLPDIAFLVVLHKLDLDQDIRPLCERFGKGDTYDLIKSQVEALHEETP